MQVDPRAGKPADPSMLVNAPRLVTAYYALKPDAHIQKQRVAFGTSGHRGSSFEASFNEDHILAITQAICEYRKKENTNGPLFLAMDTHGLSEPAFATALEVLAANDVAVFIDQDAGYTPGRQAALALDIAASDLYDAAAQVIDGSNLEEGIPALADLLRTKQPQQPNFYIELGDAMRHTGGLPGAIDAYRQALKLDPLSSRAQPCPRGRCPP